MRMFSNKLIINTNTLKEHRVEVNLGTLQDRLGVFSKVFTACVEFHKRLNDTYNLYQKKLRDLKLHNLIKPPSKVPLPGTSTQERRRKFVEKQAAACAELQQQLKAEPLNWEEIDALFHSNAQGLASQVTRIVEGEGVLRFKILRKVSKKTRTIKVQTFPCAQSSHAAHLLLFLGMYFECGQIAFTRLSRAEQIEYTHLSRSAQPQGETGGPFGYWTWTVDGYGSNLSNAQYRFVSSLLNHALFTFYCKKQPSENNP